MPKKLELSKCYAGTLAEYAHAYFIKHGINRVDSMTSHECLSEIFVEWYSIEMQQKHLTRYLQHQVVIFLFKWHDFYLDKWQTNHRITYCL
ncbi:hypothetical protein [Candidatus Enterococcus ikei]|uniref:Integrase SAM-like N-terminal domain-containing protein n=1 Tax=Candidatus Enterococcus ikei TaxID=2815326 RepID=A0ABS3H2H2_9ENTE|nr:hypothetical protein [Enterococcus sp. DIV0869a]MBO0441697.1 hypothetical protein [Enterococcus sp. DIV0869a]